MKKVKRSMIILCLVALAFLYKAVDTQNVAMGMIVGLLLLLIISRYFIIKMLEKDDGKPVTEESDFMYRYFQKDPCLYVEMKEVYRLGNCEILYEENDGILLYDHTSTQYYASAKTLAGAKDIARKLPQDYGLLIAHEEIFLQVPSLELAYQNTLAFYNYVYEKREKYVIPENEFQFKILDESYLEIVMQEYSIQGVFDQAYFLERIKAGIMGVFSQEELIGFIGLHENGAIGMLEVLKGHEGKHIATYLQCTYVNHLLEKGYPGEIYTQVNAENEVSMHIQKKLSFKRSETKTIWFFEK